ncbi:sensor histidine kinase [Rubrivirga litoralis]|uniref:histidine kinase n=1 Tax=Rubrivirga litoralis TaxID=3075598 RepID=A0ABU3BUX3_9BACT|nr:HAMP domain-containing sensor histidine kinase [Rubrivirga sp. F394]MDT0633092.1 HAMP domain-containing sensor histidine kinase [Rubrivirga sp. F394]
MRWRTVRELFYPRRASTQTWMMLTFAVFVGLAVVGVGLYSFLVLRGQIGEAERATLRDQAARFAVQLEAVPDRASRLAVGAQIAGLTNVDVAVATTDEVLGDFQAGGEAARTDGGAFFDSPEVAAALSAVDHVGFAERAGPGGEERLYVALYRPESGLLVRLGEPLPPLLVAIQRVQAVLAVGMALALVLALLGAWLAARRVTRPLQAITRSAQRINEGDLDGRIQVKTRAAEFQDLARSLNHMAGRFRNDIHELQRMQRVQNEFIGNVGHEVKNPIHAVFGYLEALASDSLAPDQRKKYAHKGLANLQRLNSLFSDLIEIARLEYREDMIRPTTFDLQDLIEEVGEMLEPKANEKMLELAYDNPSLAVHADRNRVRQVLTNLIDNAIAYSDQGSVRCRMRRHLDKARIEVVDTGRGISADHLDRVFDRFYRVDTARSRKEGGTGLGLAIVKQILEAHGETIHVESTKGRGTRFWFELPLAPAGGDGQVTEAVAARA